MAEQQQTFSGAGRVLLTAASFVVVVAGMKAAAAIIVPFLLALFIAIISLPAMSALQRLRLPSGLAVLVLIVALLVCFMLFGILVGTSLNSFISSIPEYQAKLSEQTNTLVTWLEGKGVAITQEQVSNYFNPKTLMKMIANTLAGVSGVLTNTFMILLTVVFILLEAAGFPRKLRAALPDPEASLAQAESMKDTVNRYLALKTGLSFVTGLLIWVWLTILGVDYAVLWGLFAFLFNFIPTIGSILAAIPAVLLALVQLGLGAALLTAGGFLAVNFVIGNVIEPRLMGKGLGLSALVVFLSLVFWGWVLGPVGMLLSVPLTMVVKIVMDSNEDTRWLAVMLGPSPAPPPFRRGPNGAGAT